MKVNPHTTELYKLRLARLLELWRQAFGTEPSIAEMQNLDRIKNNKKQYELMVAKLEVLKK